MAFNWPQSELTVNGKVGIGTETPAQELDVRGNIYATGDVSASNLNLNGSLTIDKNLTVGGNFQLGTLSINTFSSDENLANNSNLAVPTEQAVKTYVDNQIAQVNNVIDTKAALNGSTNQDFSSKNLSVNGNLRISGNLEVQGDVIARDIEHIAGNVFLGDADNDEVKITGVIRSGHSSGLLRIDDGLHTTGSLSVEGNMSIGTTNPQAKLEVNGKLKLQKGVAVNQFSSDGTFSSNSEFAVPTQRAVKTYLDEQIQQLKEELNKTKNELTATKKALESQIRATIASLKNEIETGSIIAQKAAMLQARDENHWMRFHRVDSSNHDLFELWRLDNKWFSTIRVQASAHLLVGNNEIQNLENDTKSI